MKNYNPQERELLILELKQIISDYLMMCDGVQYPYVCNLIQTPEGREAVEEFCIRMFVQNNTTVGDALLIKERALNPNYIKD